MANPTLSDIARATHTSISTVSRVLSGSPASGRISAETRQRVIDTARTMGYRPNLVARSLRTRRTNTVALIVSDIANPWFGQLASMIEKLLHQRGYGLMLCNSGEDPQREAEYLRLLVPRGIDGLIVVPLLRDSETLHQHVPPRLPIVVLDRPIAGVEASVSTDSRQLAGMLAGALEAAGVRRVVLAAGPEHVVTHRIRTEAIESRFTVVARHRGPATRETGLAAGEAFARLDAASYDAAVATNNVLGQGLLLAGLTPPILGTFDSLPMSELLPVPVITADQDLADLAQGCVDELLRQLKDPPDVAAPIELVGRLHANPAFRGRFPAVAPLLTPQA